MNGLFVLLLVAGILRQGTLEIDGLKRQFLVYEPETVRALVIALHGGGGNSYSFVRLTQGRFNVLADSLGFRIVYPDAIDKHWNDGRNLRIYRSHRQKVNDVAFIEALIDSFGTGIPVFITGMSNGGMMAFRVVCELSGKIDAIATVSSSMTTYVKNKCKKPPEIPLLMINGTEDPIVPFYGGIVRFGRLKLGRVLAVMDVLKFWSGNSCNTVDVIDKVNDGTKVEVIQCGGGRAVLYRIDHGGHTFPGGLQYFPERIIGRTTKEINGADVIMRFFSRILEN